MNSIIISDYAGTSVGISPWSQGFHGQTHLKKKSSPVS